MTKSNASHIWWFLVLGKLHFNTISIDRCEELMCEHVMKCWDDDDDDGQFFAILRVEY